MCGCVGPQDRGETRASGVVALIPEVGRRRVSAVRSAVLASDALNALRFPLVEHRAVAPLVHQVVHRHPAPAVLAAGVGKLHLCAPGHPPADPDAAPARPADALDHHAVATALLPGHHLEFHKSHQFRRRRREQDIVQQPQHVLRRGALAVHDLGEMGRADGRTPRRLFMSNMVGVHAVPQRPGVNVGRLGGLNPDGSSRTFSPSFRGCTCVEWHSSPCGRGVFRRLLSRVAAALQPSGLDTSAHLQGFSTPVLQAHSTSHILGISYSPGYPDFSDSLQFNEGERLGLFRRSTSHCLRCINARFQRSGHRREDHQGGNIHPVGPPGYPGCSRSADFHTYSDVPVWRVRPARPEHHR